MQKRGWMDRDYEETLLEEITKRDVKIHMLTTTIAGLITLNIMLLGLIIFFR
jgi:hypothetical protein